MSWQRVINNLLIVLMTAAIILAAWYMGAGLWSLLGLIFVWFGIKV